MKYTRYDVKSRKKNDDWKTTMIMIVVVALLAISIGTAVFFQFFYKNNDKAGAEGAGQTQDKVSGENKGDGNGSSDPVVPPPVDTTEKEKPPVEEKPVEVKGEPTYTMVQAGYFSTKESADTLKNTIGESAMVLTEDGKFRVVCYIGNEEEAVKISEDLTTKKIDNTKARFSMPDESAIDKSIKEMIKGALEIVTKSEVEGVASIKTIDFKTWTNKIKEETEDDKFATFKLLKEGINNLPEEIKKLDKTVVYQMIYDVLRTYK